MLSTPLTCCSIGVATVCSTTSALAPGYVACTTTCGGVICANIAMGRNGIATAPATQMTIASTDAKMGRSMKKLTNMVSASRWAWGGFPRRLHAHSGADVLQTVDDDLLARVHALF